MSENELPRRRRRSSASVSQSPYFTPPSISDTPQSEKLISPSSPSETPFDFSKTAQSEPMAPPLPPVDAYSYYRYPPQAGNEVMPQASFVPVVQPVIYQVPVQAVRNDDSNIPSTSPQEEKQQNSRKRSICCPKCKSTNIQVSAVNTTSKTRTKQTGCLWSIGRSLLIFFTFGLWLIVGKRKETSHTVHHLERTCICQDCGHAWSLGKAKLKRHRILNIIAKIIVILLAAAIWSTVLKNVPATNP